MYSYSSVRVGVAGATGYAGQELVRFLARHPGADLRLAMGSSATSAPRRTRWRIVGTDDRSVAMMVKS